MFIALLHFLNLKQIAWYTFCVCDYRGFRIGSMVKKHKSVSYIFLNLQDSEEASLEPSQISMMKFFCEKIESWKP